MALGVETEEERLGDSWDVRRRWKIDDEDCAALSAKLGELDGLRLQLFDNALQDLTGLALAGQQSKGSAGKRAVRSILMGHLPR